MVESKTSGKKLKTNATSPSPQMTVYATSQTITRIPFSWWEHKKLQCSTFREHIDFGDGFKEEVTLIVTIAVSRFEFKQ
jgi:hypothetical protein